MSPIPRGLALAGVAFSVVLGATDAGAYRMIQNTSVGRTTTGIQVTCSDPGGFAHWATSSIAWRLNPANQGGKAGVTLALQNALAAWTNVAPAPYVLDFAGSTGAGFSLDGVNTVSWGTDGGCSGSCLALTALVLMAGQVITEADVTLNDGVIWNTNGSDYDVQAILTHELGHTLGIHHTELTKPRNRPTMYPYYFGTAERSLEVDDQDALNCSCTRYPPATPGAPLTAVPPPQDPKRVLLASRPRSGGAVLRFSLETEGPVKLNLYDVAGRELVSLVDGVRGAGQHEVAWDGTSVSGHSPPGVYFARIETREGTARATVVLTR